jgi:hypothetical protein
LRIYNKYIISLALASCVINPLLAFFNQNDIIIYLTIDIISYLAITLLFVHFSPKAKSALNTVSIVFFAGFVVIVLFKIIGILSGK